MTASEADQYGQVHPNETKDLVKAKLKDLEAEMTKIDSGKKAAYEQATTKCPDQLTDDFKLMFLRCEVFNADLAALRLAKYWEKRLEVFGPDRAFLPLTLDGAFQDDAVALNTGYFQFIPAKDPSGRGLLLADPSRQDKTKYARASMCRALWYIMHARLEDEETQKKGVIIIGYTRHARFGQVDRNLTRMNVESIRGCLPMRLSAGHCCHPPSFFRIVWPVFQLLMGEHLRKRIRIHAGSDEQVLKRLEGFGLTKDNLPSEIGGDIVLDHQAWVADRKASGK